MRLISSSEPIYLKGESEPSGVGQVTGLAHSPPTALKLSVHSEPKRTVFCMDLNGALAAICQTSATMPTQRHDRI